MKFSIITPTHKRADKLARAVESALSQTYSNWEMIIVNDSPDDTTYQSFTSSVNDSRVFYYKNDTNHGVNYSRNFALDNVSTDSDWVIFLDDDDYLAPDALSAFVSLINTHPNIKWFVTNRSYEDGRLVTQFQENNKLYSYIWDCLLLKRAVGDVTHCIKTDTIKNIRFSKKIKQAEEWLFYYQLSLKEKLYYVSHNSTLTDGYDLENGLNFRKRDKKEELKIIKKFIIEGKERNLLYHPTFIAYLCIRLVRIVIK